MTTLQTPVSPSHSSAPHAVAADAAMQRDRVEISPDGAAAAAQFADRMKRDLGEAGTLKLASALSDAPAGRRDTGPVGLHMAAVKASDIAIIAKALGCHLEYLTSDPTTARIAGREIVWTEKIIACHAREFAAFVVHRLYMSGDISGLCVTDRIAICVRAWYDARARRGLVTADLLGDSERRLLDERERDADGLGGEHAITAAGGDDDDTDD